MFKIQRPAQEYITHTETSRASKPRPKPGAQGPRAGRDPHRATSTATRDPGPSGPTRRTAPSIHLPRHSRGRGGPIPTRIPTGPFLGEVLDQTYRGVDLLET